MALGSHKTDVGPTFKNVVFLENELSDGPDYTVVMNVPKPYTRHTAFSNVVFSDDDLDDLPDFTGNWRRPEISGNRFTNLVLSDDEMDGYSNTFESNWPPSRGFSNFIFSSEDDSDDFGPSYPTEEQVRRAEYSPPRQYTSHPTSPRSPAIGANTRSSAHTSRRWDSPPIPSGSSAAGPNIQNFANTSRRQQSFFRDLLQDPQSAVTKEDLAMLAEFIYQQNDETRQLQDSQARQILGLQNQARQEAQQPVARTVGRRSNQTIHRDPTTKELQDLIRKAAFQFMGRELSQNKNPAPIISATPDDVKKILANPANQALGPQANNLILDFNHGSGGGSFWNKKATAIFTRLFRQTNEQYTADQVSKAFRTHILQLKNQYKNYNKFLANSATRGDQADVMSAHEDEIYNARKSRRRNILHRRAEACKFFSQYPDVGRFSELWETMPFEAISGDETDHHNGQPRYVITTLPWRASWVRPWMLVFDRLHLSKRFSPSGRATPGAFPHIRISGTRERVDRECITAPVGLPRNFYCPRWLATQTEQTIADLKMQPPINPAFSNYITRVALTCCNVISHRTPPIPLQDIPQDVSHNENPTLDSSEGPQSEGSDDDMYMSS